MNLNYEIHNLIGKWAEHFLLNVYLIKYMIFVVIYVQYFCYNPVLQSIFDYDFLYFSIAVVLIVYNALHLWGNTHRIFRAHLILCCFFSGFFL